MDIDSIVWGKKIKINSSSSKRNPRALSGIREKIIIQDRKTLSKSLEERRAKAKYKFKSASPLRTMFDSKSTALRRRGYTSKQIKGISRRYKQNEIRRDKARKSFDRGISSVTGWGL